jgi:outer membrane protein OmpA-like peptidoglycan-associated protein
MSSRQASWSRRLAAGHRFTLDGVSFAGRSARIARSAGLADLARALATAPQVKVRIEAFVDATGEPARDAQLSMAMARAAGQKLFELGLAKDRLTLAGRGGERPLFPNFTARGRAANRRLEVVGLR